MPTTGTIQNSVVISALTLVTFAAADPGFAKGGTDHGAHG